MSCYNDLVDNVATLMKYWYENEVSDCYKEGMSAPTPMFVFGLIVPRRFTMKLTQQYRQ